MKDDNNNPIPDRSKPVAFTKEVMVGGLLENRVQWATRGDATESALIKFGQNYHDVSEYRKSFKKIAAIPFNSKNKFMVYITEYSREFQREEDEDCTYLLTMKGAPERVIKRCSHVMIDGEVRPMTDELLAEIEALQEQCSKEGLRVLGFAEKALPTSEYPLNYPFDTDNYNFPMGEDLNETSLPDPNPLAETPLVFLGLYALIDPPRPQVRSAVAKCKTAGIRVVMVTGDHPITAKAIARQVGIIWGDAARGGDLHGPATQDDYEEWNAIRGLSPENRVNEDGDVYFDPRLAPAIVVPGWEILPDMCHMGNSAPTSDPDNPEVNVVPKEKWDDILGHTQIVFARTSPQQKLVIVENCRNRGEIVAVTGDGVNDAPALRKADIGIAMGSGSEVSREAADMILLDDNFASIVQGVEEGRLIFDNLKKSIAYTLSSNIPEIAPFLCFITVNVPLPLSTVLILFVDLGTDMIPAISMAWENAESDIMRRPPRDSEKDHLVTKKLIFFAYLQIGVIQAMAGFFTYIVVLGDYGFDAKILPGIGSNWGLQTMWCKTKGGRFVNQDFDPHYFDEHANDPSVSREWDAQHSIWWEGTDGGTVEDCTFAAQDVRGNANSYDSAHPNNTECLELYKAARAGDGNTKGASFLSDETVQPEYSWWWMGNPAWPARPSVQDCWDSAKSASYYNSNNVLWTAGEWVSSYQAQKFLFDQGYRPFSPFKARQSVFYSNQWLMSDMYGSEYGGITQTVVGFGIPKFRLQYANFLKKSGREAEYKKWNMNTDGARNFQTGRSGTVEPVVFYTYQALGKYDISQYAQKVGDVYFPKPEHTVFSYDIGGNIAPTYDVLFDTAVNPINVIEKTEALMVKKCKEGKKQEGYDCDRLVDTAFGNAEHSFVPVKYDYDNSVIAPTYYTNADFREDCNLNLRGDDMMHPYPKSRCDENESGLKFNVMSRMMQREALMHAQTAYFVAIVIVQWADLMICKTRMNSIRQQGMLNSFMNFGLVFETLLACFFCYIPIISTGVGTRPIRATHWLPAVPFSLWIFGYDEIRKWIMRTTTKTKENSLTGQVERDAGWMERNTYY